VQGGKIGFFKAKLQKSGVRKFIWFLTFTWPFCMEKCSERKLHTVLLVNHFPLREMFFGQVHLGIFLPPRVWARRRQPPTCKSAEHGGHVQQLQTVAPVCLGPPKCLDVIYNHTNRLYRLLSVSNNGLWWNCETFGCLYKSFIVNSRGHFVK